MWYRYLPALCVAFILQSPAAAREFDAKDFHQGNCTGCHDTRVYTRSNRRVQDLPGLERQVRMCDANLGTKLFNEDVTALVQYLNQTWYHF